MKLCPNCAHNAEKDDKIDVVDRWARLKTRNLKKRRSVSDYPAYSLARLGCSIGRFCSLNRARCGIQLCSVMHLSVRMQRPGGEVSR